MIKHLSVTRPEIDNKGEIYFAKYFIQQFINNFVTTNQIGIHAIKH